MATYVIRAKCFGYNDEVFYVAGNRIANIFNDQAEAEAVYKQLEIQAARNFELYEVESLFEASEKELQRLDDYVYSRCGEHIVEDGCILEDTLPEALNDEDTFEFVKQAKMQSYQLIAFEDEIKFYGLWLLKQQDWAKEYDECFTSLVYAEDAASLKNSLSHVFEDHDGDTIKVKGEFETLTDNPILFQSVISAQEGLDYDSQRKILTIEAWDDEALFTIHPLLKQPLFEIKEISLDEVQRIEKELGEEYGYDDDGEDQDEDDLFDDDFEAAVESMIKDLAQELGLKDFDLEESPEEKQQPKNNE